MIGVISFDSVVKICDFGIAADVGFSTYTLGMGTPAYQPPEQLSGHYSKSVDIYPLGHYFLTQELNSSYITLFTR